MFKIPQLTSDVLLVNFDAPASPSLDINLSKLSAGPHALGWGLGWYPGNQPTATVIKDPSARQAQVFTDSLTDWSNFRSNIFFTKIRGAEPDYNQSEMQPFSRIYAGSDWMFMHNGDLDKVQMHAGTGDLSPRFEPVGKTDSEIAFCSLLARLEAQGARSLSDVNPATLLSWFSEFDNYGSADMYLTDGQTVCCYHGKRSPKPLRYARFTPPDIGQARVSGAVSIMIDNPQDTFRTAFIVTSADFTGAPWTQMQPGQMILSNRAKIIWDSAHPNVSWLPPAQTQAKQDAPFPRPTENADTSESTQPALDFVTSPRTVTTTTYGKALTYRLYDLVHTTEYQYRTPVEHSTHYFRLMPSDDLTQTVINSKLSLSVGAEKIQFEDVFGNQSVHCEIAAPYQNLTVTATSRVKIFQTPQDNHSVSLRQTTIPLIWMPWQRQMMLPYLLPPELPETQLRELTDYAMSFVERNDYNLLRTIEDMNRSIYEDYEYVSGSTTNSTTAFEVYSNRRGVCQDFANVFICLARLLSLPARYRMGYIYTGANYANKIQSEASHAWAEVYLPYIGWRGFDPTNGCRVSQDHVRVACGRNYIDATPTSGTIYKGGGFETLRVDVKMTEVAEETQ